MKGKNNSQNLETVFKNYLEYLEKENSTISLNEDE